MVDIPEQRLPPPSIQLEKAQPTSIEAPIQEIVLTEVIASSQPLPEVDLEQAPCAREISLGQDSTEGIFLSLDEIVEEDPDRQMEFLPKPRATAEKSQSQLLSKRLYHAIGKDGIRELIQHGEILELPADVAVIQQGDPSDRLYIVLEGALVTLSQKSDAGECSEIFDEAAPSSIVARGECWLLIFSHQRLVASTARNPQLTELLRRLSTQADLLHRPAQAAPHSPRHEA